MLSGVVDPLNRRKIFVRLRRFLRATAYEPVTLDFGCSMAMGVSIPCDQAVHNWTEDDHMAPVKIGAGSYANHKHPEC